MVDDDPPEVAAGAVGGRAGVEYLPRSSDARIWSRWSKDRRRVGEDSPEESSLPAMAPENLSEKKRETVVMASVGPTFTIEVAKGRGRVYSPMATLSGNRLPD